MTVRLLICVAFLSGIFSFGAVQAAEIKVLSAGALRPLLQDIAPDFEKSSGNHLTFDFATAAGVEERIASAEPIDVAILTKPQVDKLVRVAKLVGGSTANLASKGPDLVFVGAAPPYSEQALAAKAFIDFLAAPANKEVYKAKGFEPAERAAS